MCSALCTFTISKFHSGKNPVFDAHWTSRRLEMEWMLDGEWGGGDRERFGVELRQDLEECDAARVTGFGLETDAGENPVGGLEWRSGGGWNLENNTTMGLALRLASAMRRAKESKQIGLRKQLTRRLTTPQCCCNPTILIIRFYSV